MGKGKKKILREQAKRTGKAQREGKVDRIAELDRIALFCASLPVHDARSDDEILGR